MTAPVRIQRKRTKGWKMPENTVYVGRPGRWGNYSADGSHPAYAKSAYRHDLELGRAGKQRNLSVDDARRELSGKNLACWCEVKDKFGNRHHCHADVLLEIANR